MVTQSIKMTRYLPLHGSLLAHLPRCILENVVSSFHSLELCFKSQEAEKLACKIPRVQFFHISCKNGRGAWPPVSAVQILIFRGTKGGKIMVISNENSFSHGKLVPKRVREKETGWTRIFYNVSLKVLQKFLFSCRNDHLQLRWRHRSFIYNSNLIWGSMHYTTRCGSDCYNFCHWWLL